MSKIKLLRGELDSRLKLQLAPGIKAGFPSPAEDYLHDSLDFNRDLIKNPEATFYARISGDSMVEAGICDGDIAVIDRSLQANDGDVIVAYVNEEFTMKYLDLTHKSEGYVELRPANNNYPVFRVEAGDNFEVWGVVVHLIRTFERF